MRPPTNNLQKRPTEHYFYAEIATDITTRNSECKDTKKKRKKKISNTDPSKIPGVNSGAREELYSAHKN